MKITATDADGVLADIVLGDDSAGAWITDPPPLPAERRMAQVSPLFRGEHPFVRGRGNRSTSFAWVVARDHGSGVTAGQFCRAHAGSVPINVTLAVEDGSVTDTYSGVMAEVAVVEWFGQATVFRYGIEGAVLVAPVELDAP